MLVRDERQLGAERGACQGLKDAVGSSKDPSGCTVLAGEDYDYAYAVYHRGAR